MSVRRNGNKGWYIITIWAQIQKYILPTLPALKPGRSLSPCGRVAIYNRGMDAAKIRNIAGAVAIPVLGWFAAPIIKSLLEGTPLKGLRGMWEFWKDLAERPIPAWVGVSGVLAGVYCEVPSS